MEMNGEQKIPASREVVWAALNDPDILAACIPGCQELTKSSDTDMTAVAVIKVGPVSAKFRGAVTLSDLDPPNGYKITGEGQGGVAGFAKGQAAVRLTEQDGETLLAYQVSADIGGKLAQLGGRLIDATARKMSDAFFKKFSEEIQQRAAGNSAATAAVAAPLGASESVSQKPARTPSQRPSANYQPSQPTPAAMAPADRLTQILLAAILIGVIALGVLLSTGRLDADESASVSPFGLVALALLAMAATNGYLLGRLSAARSVEVQMSSGSFRELLRAIREGDRRP